MLPCCCGSSHGMLTKGTVARRLSDLAARLEASEAAHADLTRAEAAAAGSAHNPRACAAAAAKADFALLADITAATADGSSNTFVTLVAHADLLGEAIATDASTATLLESNLLALAAHPTPEVATAAIHFAVALWASIGDSVAQVKAFLGTRFVSEALARGSALVDSSWNDECRDWLQAFCKLLEEVQAEPMSAEVVVAVVCVLCRIVQRRCASESMCELADSGAQPGTLLCWAADADTLCDVMSAVCDVATTFAISDIARVAAHADAASAALGAGVAMGVSAVAAAATCLVGGCDWAAASIEWLDDALLVVDAFAEAISDMPVSARPLASLLDPTATSMLLRVIKGAEAHPTTGAATQKAIRAAVWRATAATAVLRGGADMLVEGGVLGVLRPVMVHAVKPTLGTKRGRDAVDSTSSARSRWMVTLVALAAALVSNGDAVRARVSTKLSRREPCVAALVAACEAAAADAQSESHVRSLLGGALARAREAGLC